jgi:ubiquinol-cytochrome c reductase cytochrome b subunit
MPWTPRWLDDRLDLKSIRTALLDRRMPTGLTWWHTLGSATFAVFLVQAVTGIALAMYYSPSPDHAYDSIRYLEHRVPGGALLRGMHYWGSSVMVVLVLAHMTRVFTWGAYKYPREANWVLGVGLLILVLGFGFTGYLLPWDQKAYWATEVGTNIAGTTPFIGPALVRLLRGGTQLGAATLSRFYSLHTLLFPLLLVGMVLLHIAMVIRQGIGARPRDLEEGAPEFTAERSYRDFYTTAEHKAKETGPPFWPEVISKDVVTATVVIGFIVVMAMAFGAGLEAPADPTDTTYIPKPEWYFIPFYQALKLVPGSMESVIAVGVPAAMILAILALPFLDRRSTRSLSRRPAAQVVLVGLLATGGLLFGAAAREPDVVTPPEIGRPLTAMERAGRALYRAQHCNSCHMLAGQGGDEDVDATDLTEIGLRHSVAWLHSFLEDPERFHPGTEMPSYGPPTLTHLEIEELTQYLSSLRGLPGTTRTPEFYDTFPPPARQETR